jgi:hypothetical protein
MQCVRIDAGAIVVDTVMPCASLVLLTPEEYDVALTNPFRLSVEDGAAVGAAIIAVWGAAFGFRALLNTLRDRDDGD